MANHKKYIFITGGVASSLGKGLAAASLGHLLEARGLRVEMLKMDPYINVDPGTMGPTQHGEVFVTDDGAETDLDLGHYERFTSLTLSRKNNFTTGQVYLRVIENEREGKYLGKTVQVVPHITDEIKRRIVLAAEDCDLLIGEIGGTVGDIESRPFLESIRQLACDVGQENVLLIHLVLLPFIESAGELKTKPAQHSVKELQGTGLFPQIIICRTDREMDGETIDKISMFCNVTRDNVFISKNLTTIYKLPISFHEQGLDDKVTELLGIWATSPNIAPLEEVVRHFEHPKREVRIGIVGKYTSLVESYKSLDEALSHGAVFHGARFCPVYIDAQDLEGGPAHRILESVDGVLVPGGFGERGIEGKIKAIEYVRKGRVPYLGICLGMQLAMVEFARHVVGMTRASSEEFSSEGEPVIHYMKGQSSKGAKGGSMRLGAYPCRLKEKSRAREIYGTPEVSERHRHRLEVNNDYVPRMEEKGLVVSGRYEKLNLVEVVEIPDHPFFIGCQYHPEFKSKPVTPHPLFKHFVEKALEYGAAREKSGERGDPHG
ncbi:MAG: CTP synthase [Bacteriovoracales bacterium]|nr:CTP synthase [Bacteriovoracales bacterium]